jgi:AraC-like DNA-binding protein
MSGTGAPAGAPDRDPRPRIDFGYRVEGPIQPVYHSHTDYEIYYFHAGKCNYLIGDRIYTLAPGDLILMYGMTLHCAKIDPSEAYVRSIVHFDPAIVRPYLELPGAANVLEPFQTLKNYRIRLRGPEKEEAERMLERMNGFRQRRDAVADNRMQLALIDLLYFLYEQCRQPLRDRKEFPSAKEKTVQQIVTWLEDHYTADLHMDELQRHMHLSKSYIAKIFKEVTGVTLFDYVYRKRINEARVRFMLDPETSVTDVCFRLGFKHLAHFSRLFKKHVGMTPEQCKKQAGRGL